MVGPFCFVVHSWLAGIAGRNKLLINMKAHLQRCAFCFAFIWFKVQGSRFRALVAASPPFLLGDARKWYFSHQSLVTPTIRGKESYHMRGMRSFGSVPTCSGWGFSTHRAFSSAQDDDTRGWKGSHLGDTLHVLELLELAVLYYDTSSPLEKGRAKGAGWIHEAV